MPSTPILALNQLEQAALVTGHDKLLRSRATLKDPYTNLSGLYTRTGETIPNAIYVKMDEKELSKSNSVRIHMKLPLTGMPVTGNARLAGTEEAPTTKSGTVYRNDYKKAVRTHGYGVRKLDQEPYGLYDRHKGVDLAVHAQEYEGLEIRQALLESFGMTLWTGDTEAVCTARWNPNFYVQGAAAAQQPEYSPTLTTYTNNIVSAIINAGGLAQSAAQAMTFQLLNRLVLEAQDRLLYPLKIGGNDAFVFVISPHQAVVYTDPNFSVNSGGAVWIQKTALSERVQNWQGIIGKFECSAGADIYVCVDPRCPTLLPGGTAAPYSLTAGYVYPGTRDARNRDSAYVRDACFLLGQGACFKWDAEKMRHVEDKDDYGHIIGDGYAGTRGVQIVPYDQADPDATSQEYYGSMVVVCSRPTY